jgi:hypothetical protein
MRGSEEDGLQGIDVFVEIRFLLLFSSCRASSDKNGPESSTNFYIDVIVMLMWNTLC